MGTQQYLSALTFQHSLPPGKACQLSHTNCYIALSKYCPARKAMSHGVSASHVHIEKTTSGKLTELTSWIGVHYDLSDVQYPMTILQTFSKRFHTGLLVVSVHQIRKHTVEKYLCLVGKIFSSVGFLDLRMDSMRNTYFWI